MEITCNGPLPNQIAFRNYVEAGSSKKQQRRKKVLLVGAGVIGSVYGTKLAEAGHEVTFLARGKRLTDLRSHGVVVEDVNTMQRTEAKVGLLDSESSLPNDQGFDLAIVTVRDRQLPALLPLLDTLLAPTTDLLFFLNCPLRVSELTSRYGLDRTFFGFPGAGGVHSEQEGSIATSTTVIRYSAVKQQPSSFGPIRGQDPRKSKQLAALFAEVGFSTAIVPDMEAWLKTHAVFITSLCGALYRAGGKSALLASDRECLELFREGVLEGFRVVEKMGFMPCPAKLLFLVRNVPKALLFIYLGFFFSSKTAEFAIDGHANDGVEDMHDLADDCRKMIKESGLVVPCLENLCKEVDEYAMMRRSRG